MELNRDELYLMEQSLNALVEYHENEIEEIKNLPDRLTGVESVANKFRETPWTVEEYRQERIKKEKGKISEIEALRKKLFLSGNNLLVVSNKIQLQLTVK